MDITKLTSQVNKIKVKNVVDMPLFYGLWILVLAVITAIFKTENWITIVLFCFAGLTFLIALFGYLFFTFKNPDYLRSEEYHLKKQSLEILGDSENILPIDARNIVDITNPNPIQITEEGANNNEND
jgi:hypothetical protein